MSASLITPYTPQAKRLREVRIRLFKTASDAARALRVPVGTYTGHENGSRNFGIDDAYLYGAAFNVSPEWILGFAQPSAAKTTRAEFGLVQPLDETLRERTAANDKLAPAAKPARVSELGEQIEEVLDLLHALDRIGDGIGGADGYAVSAVALSAKSVADNVLDGLKALTSASRAPRPTPSRACACEVE